MARAEEQESARQQLIDAVKEWREARCSNRPGTFGLTTSQECHGDNHQEDCRVERARQDILAAHNKVEQLRAG